MWIVWKTMLIILFPSKFDVDKLVDNFRSYQQVKITSVDF